MGYLIVIGAVAGLIAIACCWVAGDCTREEERSCRKGNHIYADIALQCCYDDKKMVYRYRNRCCKCGKVNEWEVPVKDLFTTKKPSTYVFVEDEEDGK